MFIIHGRALNRIRWSKTGKIAFKNKTSPSLKILEKGPKSSHSFTVTLGATFILIRNFLYSGKKFKVLKTLQAKSPATRQHVCVPLQLYTARYQWGPGNDYHFDRD